MRVYKLKLLNLGIIMKSNVTFTFDTENERCRKN